MRTHNIRVIHNDGSFDYMRSEGYTPPALIRFLRFGVLRLYRIAEHKNNTITYVPASLSMGGDA